ncbi:MULTISPECIES: FtsX-like permease family protein [unclassified Pseudoalteromonas]|uniref:ABC transporter permease n=1 Tax=unclassified Pseudoalteromonas TaxID=194690 RepID=UPI00188177CF|nr:MULTISPECIES: FtsX-like permease family protein [Gammaproteobacteria]MCF7517584.1 ABC transporter permease [Pseudoalteromonas sp. L21]UJX25246.1 ABC transporter permease [Pseudoalteromonas sp. CF6-2]|tara:strand:- start:8610 stop:9833 length:1224 start_codon:yes stop_codon:yes gene_type:complete
MIWLTLAWRNFIRNTRKSYFTLLIIIIGTVACSVGIAYINATYLLVKEGTIRGGVGHLQIATADYFDSFEESTLENGMNDDQVNRVMAQLDGNSAVDIVTPRIAFHGLISHGDKSLVFVGDAVNSKKERRLSQSFISTVDGRGLEYLANDDIYHIVIGSDLARLLGVVPGDSVTLMAVTALGGLNAIDVTIQGISKTGSPEVDKMQLKAPLQMAQELLLTDKVSRLVILLNDESQLKNLQGSLSQTSPELSTRAWQQLAPFYGQMVALYTRQFLVFGVIMGLVVTLTMGNAMLMNLFERKRELATMASMGLPQYGIRASYLLEAGILGVCAGVLGLLVSYFSSLGINSLSIDMPPPPGRTEGYQLFVLFDLNSSVLLLLAVAILCVIAAWFATSHISKISLLEAIND